MSTYTTELRYICETYAGLQESEGGDHIEQIIAAARSSLFNFDYPIFDAAYRETLETKIIRRYYTREIGFETVALFKHFLHMRMCEIMPYYNKLYNSELLAFNPLIDTDLRHSGDKSTTGETSRDGTTTGTTSDKMTGGILDESASSTTDRKTGSRDTGETEASERSGTDNREMAGSDSRQTDRAETSSEQQITHAQKSGTESKSRSDVSASNKSNSSQDLYSDTPQGGLDGLNTNGYLTNARKVSGDESINSAADSHESGTSRGQEDGTVNRSADGGSITSETGKSDSLEITDRTERENRQRDGRESFGESGRSESQGVQSKTYDTLNAGSRSETANERTRSDAFDTYIDSTFGKSAGSGTYSKMLQEFRETFLNIDMQVIDSLNDLFMGVW